MATYIETLKHNNGDIILPRTSADAVQMEDGNSVEDKVNNKQDTLTPTQLAAVNSGIDSTKVAQITTNQTNITTINSKIPSQATSSNQLADKNFVNSSIENVAAYYITNRSGSEGAYTYPPFATKAVLDATTIFYSGGAVRVPTRNDYCIVLADESQGTVVSGYASFTTTDQYINYYVIYNNVKYQVTNDNKDSLGITPGTTIAYTDIPTSRYIYNNGWEFQYIVNNSGLTAAQLATLNSDLTSADKTKLDGIETGAEVNDITDVQNATGTSLVSNKIATIPNGASGVKGLTELAQSSQITNRSGESAYISPQLINDIVKAALTDSNKLSLTDSEKLTACNTLGAEKKGIARLI